MHENVGRLDRWIRAGVGAALVGTGVRALRGYPLGPVAFVVTGAVLIETAITRVCPMNALLGVDTRALDRSGDGQRLSGPDQPSARVTEEVASAQRAPADS